jgi:hypothetical protein
LKWGFHYAHREVVSEALNKTSKDM